MDVCRRPCLCIEKMFAHLFLPQQERSCVIVRFQTSTKTNPTFCCKITRQLVGITIISYTYIEYIWIYLNLYDTWWLIKILLPIKTPACPPELDTGSVVFSILWRFESTLVFLTLFTEIDQILKWKEDLLQSRQSNFSLLGQINHF